MCLQKTFGLFGPNSFRALTIVANSDVNGPVVFRFFDIFSDMRGGLESFGVGGGGVGK